MGEVQRITFDPDRLGGRPCIRGLRVRGSDILGLLGAGATHDEILNAARHLDHSVVQEA
jgi:uncharacterized protein (DUF433 family)